jgi:hypothetical protein
MTRRRPTKNHAFGRNRDPIDVRWPPRVLTPLVCIGERRAHLSDDPLDAEAANTWHSPAMSGSRERDAAAGWAANASTI